MELLVAIGVIGILLGILVPAVQKVRAAANQASCQNKIKQLALALNLFHDANNFLPPGHRSQKNTMGIPFTGWTLSVLPFAEQEAMYNQALQDYLSNKPPLVFTSHSPFSKVMQLFVCPNDDRITVPQISLRTRNLAAFTSYLGVSGKDYKAKDGILFQDSQLHMLAITDGTSNTLAIGERPPSTDFQFGWWYAGSGQQGSGSGDLILGVLEQNIQPPLWQGPNCKPGSYPFQPGNLADQCSMFHYWSLHSGGSNFAFADGAVRFLTYSSQAVLLALSTRNGNEPITLD